MRVLTLALLFLPTLILSEPLHVPLTHKRQTKLIRNWTDELRKRYGYPTASATLKAIHPAFCDALLI